MNATDASDAAPAAADVVTVAAAGAVPTAVPAAAQPLVNQGAALTPLQKRLRSITPEQEVISRRRTSLVGKELDRRAGGGQHAPPMVSPERRIDRAVAAYNNGVNVVGWRVRAYNTVSREWRLGVIAHVAKQKARGQGTNPEAPYYVLAIVRHFEEGVAERAYEVSCLERLDE